MKIYNDIRRYDEILMKAKEFGWEVNSLNFLKGGDKLTLDKENMKVQMNLLNGYIDIFKKNNKGELKLIATHLSEEYDNQQWYQEILDILYK